MTSIISPSTPQWTARFTNTDVRGEDQLGVEGVAQSYQQYLIPGIISTTDHARYYSFYCWILYRYINLPDSPRTLAGFRKGFFKRHELAFIAACYSHHEGQGPLTGLVGAGINSYKARRIWEGADPILLDDHLSYFGNEQGGFGQYYRSVMQTMGLVAEPDSPRWIYRLTHRGEALAKAFAASIDGTSYGEALESSGEVQHLAHIDAQEYGQKACLCPASLAHGADREPLLEAFFRFDQIGIGNPHARRRLTLGLLLELVNQSGSTPLRHTLRRALYLGGYVPNQSYFPSPALADWHKRWSLVQSRHSYTSALQLLWAVFTERLKDIDTLSFEKFLAWTWSNMPEELLSMPLEDFVDELKTPLWPDGNGSRALEEPLDAYWEGDRTDEISLFEEVETLSKRGDRQPTKLLLNALRILCQIYLRHFTLWQDKDPLWQEIARLERLPMEQFMSQMQEYGADGRIVRDWLSWLFRSYCIGQHEMIALSKLRQNKYNTFKFYYQDNRFSWANNPYDYREPIRFPGLRLFNGLTILTDLGLVTEDADGVCRLTDEGSWYLNKVISG